MRKRRKVENRRETRLRAGWEEFLPLRLWSSLFVSLQTKENENVLPLLMCGNQESQSTSINYFSLEYSNIFVCGVLGGGDY
jgi:hypothetical protein